MLVFPRKVDPSFKWHHRTDKAEAPSFQIYRIILILFPVWNGKNEHCRHIILQNQNTKFYLKLLKLLSESYRERTDKAIHI